MFVFTSFIVFVSKGSKSIIKKKLKAGAMILTLTGIFACNHQRPSSHVNSFFKEYSDSIKSQRKLDSIQKAAKQKHIDDSTSNVKEKKREKDSLAKMKNKNPVRPVCYGALLYTG